MLLDQSYWEERYKERQTGWDNGMVSEPLKVYIDQILDKSTYILVPGGGNGHEVAYMHKQGFNNVFLLDWAQEPINRFLADNPSFDSTHAIHGDFFELDMKFDLILEQTFLCALEPIKREAYIKQVACLLKEEGKLGGVIFNDAPERTEPPFSASDAEYKTLFEKSFEIKTMEPCYNSIESRRGRELFIQLIKK